MAARTPPTTQAELGKDDVSVRAAAHDAGDDDAGESGGEEAAAAAETRALGFGCGCAGVLPQELGS